MNTISSKLGWLFAILILLYSCNKNSESEKESRKIFVKYKNGNIYCDGIYVVNKKSGIPINRAGIWKFYYPNGILESYTSYDEDGNIKEDKDYFFDGCLTSSKIIHNDTIIWTFYHENGQISSESIEKKSKGQNDEDLTISSKSYSENGILTFSENVQDNITTYYFFYKNGSIKRESLTKRVVTDVGEDGESETNYGSSKEYYPNGQLYNMSSSVDGRIEGEKLIWDEKGQLVLTVRYKDGFIVAN